MFKSSINGYTIEVANILKYREIRFVTLTDEQRRRHHFNMIKNDGKWIIRNPETVAPFIVQIEKDLSKIM